MRGELLEMGLTRGGSHEVGYVRWVSFEVGLT